MRKSALPGHDRRVGCEVAAAKLFEHRQSLHAAVDTEERIRMEGHAEEVFEGNENQAVDRIESHPDQERPLLAAPREMPEHEKEARDEQVHDEAES